ncbi:MAG: hypothetical protein QGG39_19125, partial [Candidatus Poribacteria bacterium]|nr:hypothetical protein [Candidatus Poribacteria bacterium]
MNANFTQTNGQIRIRPSIYTPHPADITNMTVAGIRPSDFPEISPTLELLDLSKSVSRKISQLEKKFDDYQRKSSAVLQTRNLLIGANNSDNVRYYGMPSGLGFALLLDSIAAVSSQRSSLALETRRQL